MNDELAKAIEAVKAAMDTKDMVFVRKSHLPTILFALETVAKLHDPAIFTRQVQGDLSWHGGVWAAWREPSPHIHVRRRSSGRTGQGPRRTRKERLR